MGMKGKSLAVLAAAAAVAAIAVSASGAATKATPGVTSSSILIGGTFPLTGPASLYKTIPFAEKAYFDYINDTKGGVNGRKITFEINDDGYDPSKTVPLVQQMVEKDNVFAVVGSLGTAPGLATWDYLNKHKVPQVLLATGDSYWGFSGARKYPWTTGWQPDYPGEAKLYGKYIAKNTPNAKIGVLYQNDAFGKNYYAGLRVGLGAKKGNIVDAESYDATNPDVTQQILALKAKGADTLAIFAIPTQAITALIVATKIGWSPQTYLGNVSSNRLFMLSAGGKGANVDGVISSNYVTSNTTQPDAAGTKLASQIIAQYAPALQATYNNGDANVMYGLAVGWTFVYALQHAGKTPTRAGLMNALHNMNTTNPFVYPGMREKTSFKKGRPRDNFPLEQLVMIKWSGGAGGDWHTFGSIVGGVR
jgi:branched-chain amino acid transport system substrate-binding protein